VSLPANLIPFNRRTPEQALKEVLSIVEASLGPGDSVRVVELPQKVKDWIETRPKRHCVDCHFFKFEDASGLGWCDFLNLETRCDVEGCTFHHFKTEQE